MNEIKVDIHDGCDTLYYPSIIFSHLSQAKPIRKLNKTTVSTLGYLTGRLNGQVTKFGLCFYTFLLNMHGFTESSLYQRAKELPLRVIPEMVEEIKKNKNDEIYQISLTCNLKILQDAVLDKFGINGYYDEVIANTLRQVNENGRSKLKVEVLITPRTKSIRAEESLRELERRTGKKAKLLHLHTDGKTDYPHFCRWAHEHGAQIILSPETPPHLKRRLIKEFHAIPLLTNEIRKKIEKHVEDNPFTWIVDLLLYYSSSKQTKS